MATTVNPRGKTVLILGAGASLAEAMFHHPKRDRLYPPLDRNFFPRSARHTRGGSRTDRARLINQVVARARSLGVGDLLGQSPAVSLEEHMGRLFYDLNSAASDANIRAYYDLVRVYQSELVETTNWMVGKHGVTRRLIQRELRNSDLSIVTFNHDLLIENALASLPTSRHPGAWCLAHAYGFATAGFIADNSDTFDAICTGTTHNHIPVYKLHGSLNWVYRTRNEYPSAAVAKGDRALYLWTNRQLSQSTQMRTGTAGAGRAAGRASWYMWPQIIPPVYEKHSYITGDLRHVWNDARDVLAAADRVIFWGYSFPRADLHARYFFAALAHQNDALRTPVLINPDPRSQDELWAVLQPRRVTHYRDINSFLAEDS